MADFSGLTFTVVPVVTNTGTVTSPVWALTTALTAGTTMIAGIVDPTSTQRIFNPRTEGNPVVAADNATVWLPVVKSISSTKVTDNLNAGAVDIGQVQLFLTPAAKNTVEASSVMAFYLSPAALLITATGTF